MNDVFAQRLEERLSQQAGGDRLGRIDVRSHDQARRPHIVERGQKPLLIRAGQGFDHV